MPFPTEIPVRFIVSSKTLLRWLDEISDLGEGVAFDVRPDKILVSNNLRPLLASYIEGTGVFVYERKQMDTLIGVLRLIPEEPITIVLSSWIWIKEIMI